VLPFKGEKNGNFQVHPKTSLTII